MTRLRYACIASAFVLSLPSAALALPIGTFSWDEDPLFGPLFTVENFSDSGGTFADVFVRLAMNDGSPQLSLSFDDLGAGAIGQSTDDLTAYSSLITSAELFVTFDVPGSVFIAPLLTPGSLAVIDFTPAESVPEPSTLLLTGIGLASLGWRRVRRRPTT